MSTLIKDYIYLKYDNSLCPNTNIGEISLGGAKLGYTERIIHLCYPTEKDWLKKQESKIIKNLFYQLDMEKAVIMEELNDIQKTIIKFESYTREMTMENNNMILKINTVLEEPFNIL